MSNKRRARAPAMITGRNSQKRSPSAGTNQSQFGPFPLFTPPKGRLKLGGPPPPAISPASKDTAAKRVQRPQRKGLNSWRLVSSSAAEIASTPDNGATFLALSAPRGPQLLKSLSS